LGIFFALKGGKDENILEFHFIFINANNRIPTKYRPRNVMWKYASTFEPEFRDLFLKQGPTNLGQAFLVAQRIEEYFSIVQGLWELVDIIEERYNGIIPASLLSVAQDLQERVVAIQENLSCYQVPRDEQDDDDSYLNDQEPVVAPLESYAEFQEDEGEDLNAQECSLVPSISDDEKFQEEEPQVNQVELDQQETSSLPSQ
jgi:hypothetical protein